jgi:hypothetical protein
MESRVRAPKDTTGLLPPPKVIIRATTDCNCRDTIITTINIIIIIIISIIIMIIIIIITIIIIIISIIFIIITGGSLQSSSRDNGIENQKRKGFEITKFPTVRDGL